MEVQKNTLDGGNSNSFYFLPENWGRWTHVDEHIFQMGWNHQLDTVFYTMDSIILGVVYDFF